MSKELIEALDRAIRFIRYRGEVSADPTYDATAADLQALRDSIAQGPAASLCIDGEYRCLMCDDDAALNALPHGAPLYALDMK